MIIPSAMRDNEMTNRLQSNTSFTTEKASQYLQTLCKHFGHKLKTEFTADQGLIEFPFGFCKLIADTTTLNMTGNANTSEDLDRLQTVMTNHLARFAFREEPNLTWNR